MRRRFINVFCGTILLAPGGYAGLISTATVNTGGLCNSLPETVTGTSSASISVCSGMQGGGSASTSIGFINSGAALASFNFSDSAAPFGVASSSSLFDYQFIVSGGSGSGFLNLTFTEQGVSGGNDPQASASFNVTASLNGVQYSNQRICGNPPATSGIVCGTPVDPIGITFTYGSPFELSVALNAVAGGGFGGANIAGGGTVDYSLPPGAALFVTPEPSSGILLGPAFLIFIVFNIYRRNAPKAAAADEERLSTALDR